MLSDEGLNYLFPFGITVDGKSYEQMVPGRVARVFAATTFAQNCGGGGSAPNKDWGRDENEDDIHVGFGVSLRDALYTIEPNYRKATL